MAYVINTAVNDTFILRDNSNVAITGKVNADFATVEAYEVGTPATTAAVTITEIGSGEYRISFTPTTAAPWTSHIVYNSGGVFRELSETYDVLTTQTTIVVVAAAASGAQTTTRAELRRRTAERFEDHEPLVATGSGTSSQIVDTYHVNDATKHWNGRDVICTSGTNNGLRRRVIATNPSTGTLTLNSALTTTTAANDTFDSFNKQGRGFTAEQYDRAINNAIADVWPRGGIKIKATITAAFDADTGEIVLPASVTEVNTLEAQDSSGRWYSVPKAGAMGGDGWWSDPADGQLRLYGNRAWNVHTLALRVFGLGRQDALTSDTDTCVISPMFIVAHAAYHLALGSVGNEDHAVRVNLLRDEMERYRVTARNLRDPHAAKVRAA